MSKNCIWCPWCNLTYNERLHWSSGLCGIDVGTPSFYYEIHQETNDSLSFLIAVENAIKCGFLSPGDTLVVDNASIHCRRYNKDLRDWLWDEFYINVVLLPTSSPEYNPIELLWNTLSWRLKSVYIPKGLYIEHASAKFAVNIMDAFTHKDVGLAYQKCGYIVPLKSFLR